MKKLLMTLSVLFTCLVGMISVPVTVKADATVTLTNNTDHTISWTINGDKFDTDKDIGKIIFRIEPSVGNFQEWEIATSGGNSGTIDQSTLIAKSTSTNVLPASDSFTQTIKAKVATSDGSDVSGELASVATDTIYKCTLTGGDTFATYSLADSYSHTGSTGYGFVDDTVTLTASSFTTGYEFDKWTNGSGGTTISTGNSATVTIDSAASHDWYGYSKESIIFVPVTNITLASQTTAIGQSLTLAPTVVPSNATNKTISWSLNGTNTIGGTITSGGVFSATAAGTASVKATIIDGEAIGTPYTQNFDITVTLIPVTSITLASQTTTVNANFTLVPTIAPSNASKKTIEWSLNGTNTIGATITSAGVFKATSAGTAGVTATITGGGTSGDFTENFTITVNAFIPVTEIIDVDVPKDVTVGYELALAGTGYPTVAPSNATNKTINWSLNGTNTIGATITPAGVFKATSAGTATVTATITDGKATGDPYTRDFAITVHKAPTISYDTGNRSLTVSLPEKVVTGYGVSSNITKVTGGYLEVYNNGNSVYNSGTTYQSSGKGFTISSSSVESIIQSIKNKFSGTTATIEFRITPVGNTASNTSGYERSTINATSGSVTVYEVVVSGANLTTTTYYGLAGTSLKITAKPTTGYTFSAWSDGSTSNPRTVTVSTTTADNAYPATAVLGANRSSSSAGGAAGTGGTGSGGSGSGYDPVPKTGEGNAIFFMILISVLSGLTAIVVFIKKIMRAEPVKVMAENKDLPTQIKED